MTDLQPGDLVVMNQLVVVTDLLGVALGALAGVVGTLDLPRLVKYPLVSGIIYMGYSAINVWMWW